MDVKQEWAGESARLPSAHRMPALKPEVSVEPKGSVLIFLPFLSFCSRLRYSGYFGGVTALSREQFFKVNGFSNNYWGWGGEDDDLRLR